MQNFHLLNRKLVFEVRRENQSTRRKTSQNKGENPGAPNENIVQNNLNIALLNVF